MRARTQPTKRIAALLLCLFVAWQALALPVFASEADTSGTGVSSASLPQEGAASAPQGEGEGDPATPPGEEEESLYEPEDFQVAAEAVYLVNEESGVVLYQKNAHKPLVAASLVKMMTCIIALDMVEDIDAETVMAEVWVFNELAGKNASHADIWRGETLTVRELLYAMLLPSANEAALMLANYVADGYMPNFIYMMNTYAEQLGCTNTVFVDPNGLSAGNLTTAHDMYLITRKFMSYPLLVEIASTSTYKMDAHNHSAPYNIFTTNRLLVTSDPYAKKFPAAAASIVAGKTGSLGEWQNFCSVARQGEVTYYCAMLESPNTADEVAIEQESANARPALFESARLYNWAFKNFEVQPTLDTTKPITEVRVLYSTEHDSVKLLPENDLKTMLPTGGENETTLTFDVPENVEAPVEAGQPIGTVTVSLRGRELGTVNLVAAQSVSRNSFKFLLEKLKNFVSTAVVRTVIVIVVAAAAGYVALLLLANWRHKRKKQVKKNNRRPPPGQKPKPR